MYGSAVDVVGREDTVRGTMRRVRVARMEVMWKSIMNILNVDLDGDWNMEWFEYKDEDEGL
jgi:hypothetical protein